MKIINNTPMEKIKVHTPKSCGPERERKTEILKVRVTKNQRAILLKSIKKRGFRNFSHYMREVIKMEIEEYNIGI